MGVSVRQKDDSWYIFIRHAGDRAAQKYGSEEEAQDVAKAVRHAIALGHFDIAALKKQRQPAEEEKKPDVPTLKKFFEDTVSPLWEASLAKATFTRYEGSFRLHSLPAIGELRLDELMRDRIKSFVVSLLQKTAPKRTHGEERQAEEFER